GSPADARQAEGLLRCRRRRRQDLRDAGGGPRPARRRRGRRGRRGRDAPSRGDRGAARGPRDPAAPQGRIPRRDARGARPRRRAGPASWGPARRRAGAHQCPGEPPPQALSGRARAARRGPQRVHDAERPAPRVAERPRREDHRRRRARDRARLRARRGRRRRAGGPARARLVRAGHRLAAQLAAPWVVAYVETAAQRSLGAEDRARVAQTLRLAESLGAETVTLTGTRMSDEILAYARSRNVSKLVIGKPTRGFWPRLFLGSIVDTLVRGSGEVDIYVISGDGTPTPTPRTRTRPRAGRPLPYAAAI